MPLSCPPLTRLGRVIGLGVLLSMVAGCQTLESRLEEGTVETGPRWDEDGKFTDEPKVTVPLWRSGDGK